MFFKKVFLSFTVSLLVLYQTVFAATLIPSGQSIGIKLNYEGVMITGSYDITVDNQSYNPFNDGLSMNDIITHVNGIKVTTVLELSTIIKDNISNNKGNILTVLTNNSNSIHILKIESKSDEYNTGLYVKDSIMGIGTLTYYNPETNSFGSLGHAMSDLDLNSESLLNVGEIYLSNVTGIIKGSAQSTGQKIAQFEDVIIGIVDEHSQYGIYGIVDDAVVLNSETMETASIEEVTTGEAYFLTVINNNVIEKCFIDITQLKDQSQIDTKGITFVIRDENILQETNGIIQGMSGSPIIQNNKIIGCVTHVSSSDPTIGYGLYIDWMLENDALNN